MNYNWETVTSTWTKTKSTSILQTTIPELTDTIQDMEWAEPQRPQSHVSADTEVKTAYIYDAQTKFLIYWQPGDG